MANVLIIDDDEATVELWHTALSLDGHNCAKAHDGESALDAVRSSPPDIAICDIVMPGLGGVAFTGQAKLIHPGIKIIAVSGDIGAMSPSVDALGLAKDMGADATLAKPISIDDLCETVRQLSRQIA